MGMQRNLCSRKWIWLIYFEQQDCSPACWLQVRTKYLAFADWEDALNPARKKIVPDVIKIIDFFLKDEFSQHIS